MRSTLVLMLLVASLCQAQPTPSLLMSSIDVEDVKLMESAAGQLWMSVTDNNNRLTLYRIDAAGGVVSMPLPSSQLRSVQPLGRELIAIHAPLREFRFDARGSSVANTSGFEVQKLDGSTHSEVLYEAAADAADIRTTQAFSQDALYVIECPREGSSFVRRVDAAGKIEWTFDLSPSQCYGLEALAIPGGLLVQRSEYGENWGLLALSDSGDLQWQIAAPRLDSAAVFVPPHQVAVLERDDAREAQRLTFIDVRDGTRRTEVPIPRGMQLRPASSGVLLLAHDEVRLVRPDGSVEWTRRYAIDGRHGSYIYDGLITRNGELVQVGASFRGVRLNSFFRSRNPSPTDSDPEYYVDGRPREDRALLLLRTSATNPVPTPACLDVDSDALNEVTQRLLHVHGVYVSAIEPTSAANTYAALQPCPSLSNGEYFRFLSELDSHLGTWRAPSIIGVEVGRLALPWRRASYGDSHGDGSCWHIAPSSFITYEADASAGATLAAHLQTRVGPHLAQLQLLYTEFERLTGRYFWVPRYIGRLSDARLFDDTAAAATRVLGALKQLPVAALAAYRNNDSERPMLSISHAAFGPEGSERALTEADATLREMFGVQSRRR